MQATLETMSCEKEHDQECSDVEDRVDLLKAKIQSMLKSKLSIRGV